MDESDFTLVMPFVCVTSVGGPYDDDSFVAGMRLQELRSTLAALPVGVYRYQPPFPFPEGLSDQIDLVAMEAGFKVVGSWFLRGVQKDPDV